MEPELICDYKCEIGENPLWHPFEKRLCWCDIATGRMFRYDPSSGKHEQFYQGEVVGGFTIQADGSLLLFMAKGAVKIWREGGMTTVIDHLPDEQETRFNDVIADPAGRVFCGTMPTQDRLGRLYRLDLSGEIKLILEGISCPNGLAFSLDRRRLYFTDSKVRTIYRFDYDEQSGEIDNRQVFAKLSEQDGFPDGMTIDSEGHIWSALWDGAALARFTPEGREEQRLAIPARKASSLIFGGEDLSDIYVTTAGGEIKASDGPAAGSLFRLTPGVRGVPEFFSRVSI
jgi:D-xylono/L-arabinono-1,4-lactonase